jgi:hypothetical protein
VLLSCSHSDHLSSGAGHVSPRVTIEALPDDTLLDIFYFRLQDFEDDLNHWARNSCWIILVHVCQRWRYVVFASPVRLDLCLSCTDRTPVRETLNVWPPLPIRIWSRHLGDNILAALEHRDRVRGVSTSLQRRLLEHLITVMQESFPALECLSLGATYNNDEALPVLPSTFLCGSAPRLHRLILRRISLPTLPQLLSSSNDLVYLSLYDIPSTGYISPEAMATCICALTRLTNLRIIFSSGCVDAHTLRDRRAREPSPLTRAVLASLTEFKFSGHRKYCEYLVARIEAPVLSFAKILLIDLAFPNQPSFDVQNLARFISQSQIFMSFNRAEMKFGFVELKILPPTQANGFTLGMVCEDTIWQLACMAQICHHFSLLLSGMERLGIDGRLVRTRMPSEQDPKWLEVFRPFTSVQSLQISGLGSPLIVSALERLSRELATNVFPSLSDLYVVWKGDHLPVPESEQRDRDIGRFITARQCSNHPVVVHYLEDKEK